MVGVPKTIDNDLSATELTFGFDTAVQIATDAIDRLHTTAESHDRVMVFEVMGRHAGHIATWAGDRRRGHDDAHPRGALRHRRGVRRHPAPPRRAGPLRLDRRGGRGRHAEGGHAGRGVRRGRRVRPRPARRHRPPDLAEEIEERTGYETRVIVLGHVQRGGTPTAFDRVLATRFGIAAIDAVHDGTFGQMVALRAGQIVRVPLAEATGRAQARRPRALRRGRGVLRLGGATGGWRSARALALDRGAEGGALRRHGQAEGVGQRRRPTGTPTA